MKTKKAQMPKAKTAKAQMPKAKTAKAQMPKFKTTKVQMPKVKIALARNLKAEAVKNQTPQAQTAKTYISKPEISKFAPPRLKAGYRVLLYLTALVFAGLSIMEAIGKHFYLCIDIIIYVAAAGSFSAACYYLVLDINSGIKDGLKPKIESNHFTNRMLQDYRYRAVLFTCSSFALNLIFAFSNTIFGILNRSIWLVTLSAYYIILSVMRFSIAWYEKKVAGAKLTEELQLQELAVYRRCGILLILLTVVSGGTTILIVHQNQGKNYPGTLIFAVAAYTFYKIIMSVVNIIKAGRLKSPLMLSIRSIGYADALVSLLSLQTAMFTSFGEGSDIDANWMNGMTGTVVCGMIFLMGIYMVYTSQKSKTKHTLE